MNGAQKVDKRKVEINKFSLIFNKLGIYVVVLLLIVAGVILSAASSSRPATSSPYWRPAP